MELSASALVTSEIDARALPLTSRRADGDDGGDVEAGVSIEENKNKARAARAVVLRGRLSEP